MGVRFVHVNLVARDWKLLSDFYQHVFNCKPVLPFRLFNDGSDSLINSSSDLRLSGRDRFMA